jgi:flavin-dependent dehydrogenase
MNAPRRWDAVVVGAGPAGATAAALLADQGHRVVVLDKDDFPRFHIGESLLPMGLPVLERLGVQPAEEAFVYKRGAEFICEASGRRQTFDFSEALPGPPRHAWQVDRASFDTLVRDRAATFGAEFRHGEKVTSVAIHDDGVEVETGTGKVRGRFLIDATGQDRLMARRGRTAVPYKTLGKAAVFAHYDGLSDAAREEIGPGHDIRILTLEDGWAWLIPLPGRRLSVGLVSSKKGLTVARLDQFGQRSPLLRRWTEGAERTPARVFRNFSYRNSAPNGARYACVGDAACFLDPVFSSGVSLALASADLLAARLAPALEAGREAEPGLMAPVDDQLERAYQVFAALIHRFYNSRFAENIFLSDPPNSQHRRGVISVLSGDVWRDDNRFQAMLLGARRRGAQPPVAL